MASVSEDVLKQVLALPIEERAELLEHLLSSFQGSSDPGLDQLWVSEAHDRLAAFDRGEIDAVDAEEVFENLTHSKK